MSDAGAVAPVRIPCKQLALAVGLGLGSAVVAIACSEPEPISPVYAGSCPILIECVDELDPDRAAAILMAYGDPDDPSAPEQGSCWASGLASHQGCRDSCVDALVELNFVFGRNCGECNDDGDCAAYGSSATCSDEGFCARAKIGDIEIDTTTGAEAGSETGSEEPPDESDSDGSMQQLDAACEGDNPRVVVETSLGSMTIELDSAAQPLATELFLLHVSADFYDNTLIHKVSAGALVEGGAFSSNLTPLTPRFTLDASGAPTYDHSSDSFALTRGGDGILGAGFYLVDPPGPAAPNGVPIGALVEGAEVRDAIAAVEVFDLAWNGFVLQDLPTTDIEIVEAYCD